MANDIVILGNGGHAKSVADSIIRARKYRIAGYTDLVERDSQIRYLGTDDRLKDLYDQGVRFACIGIGYLGESFIRDKIIYRALEIGFQFPAIIDPTSIVISDTKIGMGTYIGKNVIVNSGSVIGSYCILNTGVIVEHENIVGEFSHIAVGSVLCGRVEVGHHSLVGAGSTVIQGISIGNECIVGVGSVVVSDIPDKSKAYGNPCRVVG